MQHPRIRWSVWALVAALAGCGVYPGAEGGDPYDGLETLEQPPVVPYCQAVSTWDPAWQQLEAEVLRLTNLRRAEGADCRTEGVFGPAAPLTANDDLRCSARNHSMDMAVRDYFDHENLDGESPFERIDKTGYRWMAAGENIAAGQTRPEEVVDGWMGSDGHCRNIMSDAFTELGVGYYLEPNDTYRHYWTQNFGAPW